MPDELELQARGSINDSAKGDTFKPVSDSSDPSVVRVGPAGVPPSGNEDFEGMLASTKREDLNPQQQAAFDGLVKAYHRKANEMHQERLAMQSDRAQINQILQTIAQNRDTTPAQKQEQAQSFLDKLPKGMVENMTPEAKTVMDTLGLVVRDEVASARQQITESSSREIARLQQELEQTRAYVQQQALAQNWQAQAQAVNTKYGAERVAPYGEQIVQALQAMPYLSVEQALGVVAPQVVQDYWMQEGAKRSSQRTNAQQAAALENLRGNFGGDPTATYRPGESMADSARAVGALG